MTENLRHWLALFHVPGIGPAAFDRLLETFPHPEAVLDAPESRLQGLGLRQQSREGLRHPDWNRVDADLAWAEQAGNSIITRTDPRYPPLLDQVADPPPLLFIHGDPDILSLPQLAIVGSRNPTPAGTRSAHDFAAHLARAGLTITSGLALGIDGAAHEGALSAAGQTIAVMGTGLDRVYPASHRDLAHRIAEQGALVSEYPLGTPPRAENFPRRNRIISGMSLGTLVVEAALRSGSLITARMALEQGREVFAIPGSIHNPLARGCHSLIRQGAKLVETARDIAEELGALAGLCAEEVPENVMDSPGELAPEYVQLLDSMGYEPVTVDELVTQGTLTAEEVSSMLLLLELQDFVATSAGGRYVRTEKRA